MRDKYINAVGYQRLSMIVSKSKELHTLNLHTPVLQKMHILR